MLIALLEEGHGQGSDEEQQGKEEAESGPQQEAKGHRHGRRPGQDARRQEVTVKSAALELNDFFPNRHPAPGWNHALAAMRRAMSARRARQRILRHGSNFWSGKRSIAAL